MIIIGLLTVTVLAELCIAVTVSPINYLRPIEGKSKPYSLIKFTVHPHPKYPKAYIKGVKRPSRAPILLPESDNVRDEFFPVSRQNLMHLKQPSYLGRSPSAAPTKSSASNSGAPFQVNQQVQKYQAQQEVDRERALSNKKPVYQDYDGPFLPLMKPSPINTIPFDPPNFTATRNYVNGLKQRHQKFFNKDDDEKPAHRILPNGGANSYQNHNLYTDELSYFQQREKEIGDEARGGFQNNLSEQDFGKNDRQGFSDSENSSSEEAAGIEKVSSTESSSEEEQPDKLPEEEPDTEEPPKVTPKNEEIDDDSKEEPNLNYPDFERNADIDDSVEDETEEESRKREQFIPYRLYAQVRHVEAENHKPRPVEDPQIKEKISTAKKNLYYSEDGYDEKEYDHGNEERFGAYKEVKNGNNARRSRSRRVKRDTLEIPKTPEKSGKSLNIDFQIIPVRDSKTEVEFLPIALALMKKSDLANLTGEKLLAHLDELIRNSSIYLPDEPYDNGIFNLKVNKGERLPNQGTPYRASYLENLEPDIVYGESKTDNVKVKPGKYPYYTLPPKVLTEMSALRYAEAMKNLPLSKSDSLYDEKESVVCEEIDQEPDPVPKDIETSGASKKSHKNIKRLKNLGDKIACLKKKYFGENPFDNPLFKEEYVAAAIPIPWKVFKAKNELPKHQMNPLITVYDDVINNIRAGILEETKKIQVLVNNDEKKDKDEKKAQESIINATIADFDLAGASDGQKYYSGIRSSSKVPIFDITQYYPRFKVRGNDDILYDDEDTLPIVSSKNTRQVRPTYGPETDLNKNSQKPNLNKNQTFKVNGSFKVDDGTHINGDYVMEYVEAPPIKRNYKDRSSSSASTYSQQLIPQPITVIAPPQQIQTIQQQVQQQVQQIPGREQFYPKPPARPPNYKPKKNRYTTRTMPQNKYNKRHVYHFKLL